MTKLGKGGSSEALAKVVGDLNGKVKEHEVKRSEMMTDADDFSFKRQVVWIHAFASVVRAHQGYSLSVNQRYDSTPSSHRVLTFGLLYSAHRTTLHLSCSARSWSTTRRTSTCPTSGAQAAARRAPTRRPRRPRARARPSWCRSVRSATRSRAASGL